MSMWSGISQIKQTLSDEFQQASTGRKLQNDPVSVIERNAKLLDSEPANVDDIIESLGDENGNHIEPRNGDAKAEDALNGKESADGGAITDTQSTSEEPNKTASSNKSDGSDELVKAEPAKAEPTEAAKVEPVKAEDTAKGDEPAKVEPAKTPAKAEGPAKEPVKAEEPSKAAESAKEPVKSEQPAKAPVKSEAAVKAAVKAAEPAKTEPTKAPAKTEPAKTASNGEPAKESPELATKLAKFAKYESMYPRLLKAYKEEKKRYELVKLYEKVLADNTPCHSISEPQLLVDYLQDIRSKSKLQTAEIDRIGTELSNLRKEQDSTKADLQTARKEVVGLRSELEQSVGELKRTKDSKEERAENRRIDSELRAKVELLESQLAAAEQARDASTKSLTTVRTQLDELHTRLKETVAESESLRDELHDSERVAEEHLKELSSLKSILRHREKGDRASVDKTDSQLSALMAEKELLESEVELLNKRIVRESEPLQMQIKSLRARLEESEAHEEELRKQLKIQSEYRARQDRSSHESLNSLDKLSTDETVAALADARAAAANAAKANELLKEVNKDHLLRIERLQKSQKALTTDIEQLRHENLQLKRRAMPSASAAAALSLPTSPTSPEPSEDREKQQAYLKNVLLGFIQHKDQRKALMPVLATLLDLKDSEIDKFMNGFA